MYLAYYKLAEPPFELVPQAGFFYWTAKHRATAAQIADSLLYKDGHVALLGEVDTGKTQFVKTLIEGFPPALKKAYIYQIALSSEGLINNICRQMGLAYNSEAVGEVEARLLEYLLRGNRKKKTLLIIDNAEHLQEADMQLLALAGAEGAGRLQILLVGCDRAEFLLARVPALSQSFSLQARLASFNRGETQEYIEHRLGQAQCPRPRQLFSSEASDVIYSLSAGIPRRINGLCDRALTQGYKNKARKIGLSVVLEAKDEQLPVEAFVAL